MAVMAEHIVDGTIATVEIGPLAITAGLIAAGAITTGGTNASNTASGSKVEDAAIGTLQLVDDAVSALKLGVGAAGPIPQPDQLYTRTVIATNFNDVMYAINAGGITLLAAKALSTGKMYLVPIYLRKGQVVTSVSFTSIGAAVNPANWWFALYNAAMTKLGQSADQTTTAWGATTKKTLALLAAYTVPADGYFHVGIMMKADTPVTVNSFAMVATSAHVGETADTTLTTTAPATAGAITPNDDVLVTEIV